METFNKTTRTDIYKIDPRAIVVTEGFNSRSDFGNIEELANQIKEQGMLNPITVIPFKDENGVDKYRLVDGERRYRASMHLIENGVELPRIPAIFESKSLTESEMLLQQIMRNEGKPFSEYEYGVAYKKFKAMGFTNDEIAAKVGKKIWHVDCCLAHLERDERVQELMRKGVVNGVDVRKIYQSTKNEAKAVAQLLKLANKAEEKGEKKVSLKDLDFDADYNITKDTAAIKKGLYTFFLYVEKYTDNGKIDLDMDIFDIYSQITDGKKTIKEVFETALKEYKKAE